MSIKSVISKLLSLGLNKEEYIVNKNKNTGTVQYTQTGDPH